jgi:hypothetical protein
MDDFVCLTLLAKPGETASLFQSRLYAFWTHMLRNKPDDYERVYAEATEFESEQSRVSRRYMVQPDAIEVLQTELAAQEIAFLPVDMDDLYSKAEASSSEWFQLEH